MLISKAVLAPSLLSVSLLLALLFSSSLPVSCQGAATPSQKIVAAAKDSVGKEMWKPGFGLREGYLGCAASVSNVLKKAGIKGAYSAATKFLRAQLLSKTIAAKEFVVKDGGDGAIDDKRLADVARPGDVLVAFMSPLPGGNIGAKAHCGIIAGNGNVFTNDWNDGIWKHADIHRYFDSYRYIRVLRIGAGGHNK